MVNGFFVVWAISVKLDAGLDYSAGVVCPGTAKTLWTKMEGHDRLLSRRDIEPSTAKYTFHCILRSLSFCLFVSVHNNILQHIGWWSS